MIFFLALCVLHVLTNLIPFILTTNRIYHYEAVCYEIFAIILLLPLSSAQIPFFVPCYSRSFYTN